MKKLAKLTIIIAMAFIFALFVKYAFIMGAGEGLPTDYSRS